MFLLGYNSNWKRNNEYINVTPLAYWSNEIKWIIIDFFLRFLVQALMFPCTDTTRAPLCTLPWLLTLHWPLITHYPTADRSHSGNMGIVKSCKKYTLIWKKIKIVSMYTMCFILVISFWFDCHNFNADVHLCCTFVFIDKILIIMTNNFKIKSGRKLFEI